MLSSNGIVKVKNASSNCRRSKTSLLLKNRYLICSPLDQRNKKCHSLKFEENSSLKELEKSPVAPITRRKIVTLQANLLHSTNLAIMVLQSFYVPSFHDLLLRFVKLFGSFLGLVLFQHFIDRALPFLFSFSSRGLRFLYRLC
uniref:Uncharacterized protein n=1 Tax=Polytomella parva TaxID=51329 RepID=A0A7S0VA69_9CHLO|mmetsp:Transcript_34030/g.61384  ORF Transcript_34030/g.61384 Transcript_34030/m.61384 type:complete len:143 (+) Transcript_34030:51-479(+)